ncbi:mucin-5AC isoform X2 [Bombyx mori]|uniref:KHDC4/BBP-like KH-domain type I domain-containing protein n=1 Tax=Bombyx mori TaxID=7091 RepID=A0A8R1WJ27_BOMMO|nr:flocculation protein FLO11 isoform X2 [Bombyx mori]
MSGGLVDKVYIGLDNAPAAFDIKGRILGPNGTNLEYIRSETGVVAVLKGDKLEPLHLALHHTRSDALAAARSLAQNLIETIRAELAQWSAAQAGGPPQAMNVPPPTLTTTSAPQPVPPPTPTAALATPPTLTSTVPAVIPPVVSVAPAPTPLMTVRQPTVLQLLPQQQYVYNQENGQLIPIVQPGVQVSNTNFTSLPIAQQLGLQQPNYGATQIVDISSMQPVNVTQLRLSGVPSSMSMLLPNGFTFPQASLSTADTTVSSATATPVVCAAQGINSSQKILYSSDKDKDVKYHIQGTDTVQWTVPGSQTMLIPYQQLQDLSSCQQGLSNLQPQQFVSIAPAGGLQQTLPLTAAQLQQLQTGTIMQLNQKNSSTPTKNAGNQESRGQKRLSDGTPSQLQLRPIAPAGSHVSLDKSTTRETRSWTAAAGRENTVVSMGMKINPTHGTIIHVSSGQQTNVSATGTQDGTGMYIRQIDKNSIQIQSSKDNQKQDLTKVQSTAQNVQMITVPQGMTVLQNPLNISQMPTMLGQPNNQVYMIPANQSNLVQGALQPGLLGQQVLQSSPNVTVVQPNQLGVPGGVQYNVPIMPMNMPANSQYMPTGLSLNNQLSAHQLNAALSGHQLNPNLAVSGTIPIVQAPPSSPLTNPQIAAGHAPSIPQIMPQNSFINPTSQYGSVQQQYMMQNSGALTVPNNNVQYTIPNTSPASANNGNGQTVVGDTDNTNGSGNQTTYITSSSQDNGYSVPAGTLQGSQQNFSAEGSTATQGTYTPVTQASTPGYGSTNGNQAGYISQTSTTQPPNYQTNGSNPPTPNQNYTGATSSPQTSQSNFSPSTTPAPNQSYPGQNLQSMQNVGFAPNQNPQNPYPNATGQNLAAYASNQYQYTSRPWFRPRYGSPQGSPYSSGAGPPPNGAPMPVPPPSTNYNYWPDS